MQYDNLTIREKNVLRYVVQQFILTAAPVGSRNMAKRYDMNFSPATIRNIMSDLEESGFINHPHTSAGRVPTDKGYRFYVDTLMNVENPDPVAIREVNAAIETVQHETTELLNLASKMLGTITNQLACVIYPNLDSGILEKIQLLSLSTQRLLVVLSIQSGLVRTITLEINSELKESRVEAVQSLLNEKLGGLSLREIRGSFVDRLKEHEDNLQPILRVFFDSVEKIFTDNSSGGKAIISGAGNLLRQPEFENPEKLQTIIELIEEKDIIVHVFEKSGDGGSNSVKITIGSENENPRFEDFSLVTKEYSIGDVTGMLGVVGPKRMEYSKIVAMVDYISQMLNEFLKKNN